MAFVVEKWIEWFVPRFCIKVIARGAHIFYLLRTGRICAAFWAALGFGAHGVDYAPLEVSCFSNLTQVSPYLYSLAVSCIRCLRALLCVDCTCCD